MKVNSPSFKHSQSIYLQGKKDSDRNLCALYPNIYIQTFLHLPHTSLLTIIDCFLITVPICLVYSIHSIHDPTGVTIQKMVEEVKNANILFSKGNISSWGNPRKIGISYSYKGAIVQVLSWINLRIRQET